MKASILIIEDEPAIVDAMQYVLEDEGFATIVRSTGSEVPMLLEREDISLIVLDIGLPDISGLELIKLIRPRFDVPVIFLTARSSEIDRVLGLELGGDDYVVKPFSPRELAARVKAILRRTGQREKELPPVSASVPAIWRVDADRRQIFYHGVGLELSRYEYNLLGVLLHSPGRVFTREHLMRLAWEEPDASMERTVDAHIKNIRAKLKAIAPDDEAIVTHRGVGYALHERP
ncbi:MAG: two-component system response regulator CreB [Desulfobulbus sp.]|jgi:two-component system catabolic regulation response regulator CreB|uniref:two-component system response regulator CreB n=1 Tax=Desulfobulbus sp. TaxID=895 RepID=UPI00283E955B|nr:two-component system response regulator CreB [Desulfobulbus sp.]MDR2549174.1 two-component system response regulator CreB [Desulfobulbus sp.]